MTHWIGERTIVTSYVNPPIPTRAYDYVAYFDDLGADDSPNGYGETEREAIADLLEQME